MPPKRRRRKGGDRLAPLAFEESPFSENRNPPSPVFSKETHSGVCTKPIDGAEAFSWVREFSELSKSMA